MTATVHGAAGNGASNGAVAAPAPVAEPVITAPPTAAPVPAAAAPATPAPAPAPAGRSAPREAGELIKGVGAAIVKNMEASLDVPTATSFRNVPAKLLEVNRKVINGYRSRSGLGKVSFTHLIGFAIIRAIAEAVPNMRNGYLEGADGKPRLVRHDTVNMGLAVDVDKGDGTRALIVPVLKGADALDFAGFLTAYEELIRKVKNNKLTIDDYAGANITLTNPGTIGTVQSVPRLMPGQGVIVGVGNIDYPAEFEGADRRNLSSLGISKVVTITSTYDHRIIQGAESGLFLKRVHELLLGEHGFYERDLPRPRHAVRGGQVAARHQPDRPRRGDARQADGGREADPRAPRARPPHRRSRPAALEGARHPGRARPRHLRPHHLGPRPRVPVRRRRRPGQDDARRSARRAPRRVLPHHRRRVHAHPEHRGAGLDPAPGRAEAADATRRPQKDRILERLNAAEAFERFLATKYVGTKRFGIEGAESAIPILDEILSGAADDELDGCGHRHGPPRPPERAVEHHRQELRGDLLRVRGPRRPVDRAGLGRREVPPRRDRQVREPHRRRHQGRARRQPEPPRDGRPDRDGHGARPAGPHRPARRVLGAADPDPRRRRVRRPGHRGRVPRDERHRRLPRRRHDPPHHQQPDRVHHRARDEPLVVLLQRRREDGPGADLPRERRRPRGVRAGGAAGVGLPPGVPQGRRDRHGLLPPVRPQRGRRPELHAAADVQGDRRAAQRAQAVRRGAREARRHHASRRPSRRSATSRTSCRWRSTRPARRSSSRTRRPSRRSRSACCRTSPPASTAADARPHLRPAHRLPAELHAAPEAR